MLEPLPVGAWAFCAVTAAVATKTLTFGQAFSAFTNDVIWLIVVSFFFARVRGAAASSSARAGTRRPAGRQSGSCEPQPLTSRLPTHLSPQGFNAGLEPEP